MVETFIHRFEFQNISLEHLIFPFTVVSILQLAVLYWQYISIVTILNVDE